MISIAMALKLKAAGLMWPMDVHDFFAIPNRQMDGRTFVLTDMMAYKETIKGWPVVTFHGTSEWALDYILTDEVVWLPTEMQLREMVMQRLAAAGDPRMHLSMNGRDITLEIAFGGESRQFKDENVSDALAQALLFVMAAMPKNETAD